MILQENIPVRVSEVFRIELIGMATARVILHVEGEQAQVVEEAVKSVLESLAKTMEEKMRNGANK